MVMITDKNKHLEVWNELETFMQNYAIITFKSIIHMNIE